MDISTDRKLSAELLKWRPLPALSGLSLTLVLLALTLPAPARSQDAPPTPEEIARAAREAREHKANSAQHPKIITNDELIAQSSVPSASPASPDSSPEKVAQAPKSKATGCDSANAETLKAELQSSQDELDQIRSQLSSQPEVISNNNIDLRNFKPGSAGPNMGAPALLETKSPSPARLAEVNLQEKVASLKRAVRIACASPEDAEIQAKIDAAEQQLTSLERALALDQDTYYSNPNYAGNAAGKAKLDAELEQKQSLQSEIDRLKSELSAPKPI